MSDTENTTVESTSTETNEVGTTQEVTESTEQSTEQVTETQEVAPEKEESKEGFLDALRKKFRKEPKAVEEEGETEEEDASESAGQDDTEKTEKVEEEIDATFTAAAEKAGWNADQIKALAGKYTNEQLKQIIPFLNQQKQEAASQEAVEEKETDIPENIQEVVKPYLDAIAEKYEQRIKELEDSLGYVREENVTKELRQITSAADSFFDTLGEKHSVFGKTSDLPRFPEGTPLAGQVVPAGPAFEARSAVWDKAKVFYQLGGDWNGAMQDAYNWYKGKFMDKDIHNKLVRDLKSNEKRLSPKRTSVSTVKKYESESDEKESVVLDAARRAGIAI